MNGIARPVRMVVVLALRNTLVLAGFKADQKTFGGTTHAANVTISPIDKTQFSSRNGRGRQGAALAAPYIRNAEAAETTTWKVQTSWPAGIGLATFKTWCGTIKEQTGGELEFKPFAAKEVVGDFELLDGVKNGALEAMNSFTLYWAGKLPATAFLSSYLMGLRYPHEWDVFFYSKGGIEAARDVFEKQGLMYVGRIHHGPNIIHSKKPIRSIEDFKDLKLRVPGGMIAEGFAAAGAKTTYCQAAKCSRPLRRAPSRRRTIPDLP